MSANTGTDLLARLRMIRDKAAADAPMAACRALGQAGETAVKVTLSSSSHPKGTPTPSRPGMPPSLVTGRLRRSVTRTPPREAGAFTFVCAAGTAVIYGPVQEYGAVIRARRFPQLGNPDAGFFGAQVRLPPRPFMRPAALRLAASGLAAQAAIAGWNSAMDF